MAFLAPLFLLALAAVAVPVAIHLTHRQRREPVAFPSLMFLRRVEFRTAKRQRIRNLLLFALRTLAVLLLALAFARPWLSRGDGAVAAADVGRDVVVLLDGSFSMRHGDRWSRAQAEARRVIDGLGPADRATVVRFAARAEALLEPTGDKGALRAAVDAARPGDAAGRYAPAFTLARAAVGRAQRPRREVVLVSDLQRTGWQPGEELRLPSGTAFSVVDVGDASAANVTVTGVDFVRGTVDGREQVTASVRVGHLGGDDTASVPVSVALDGREVARQVVRVPAGGAATAQVGPFALPAGTARGVVRAGSDALDGDNARHFTLDRGRSLGVLLVQDPTASPSRTLYLRRALAVGDDPAFRVDVHREGELRAADLEGRSLVILDDARAPRGESARRLAEWVRAGGGLLVATGERTRPGDWAGDLAPLLPASIGETVDRMGDRGGRLGTLDRTHPVLEPFAAPGSGNFSAPRFFRYRPLTPAEGATALARFDDGSVALAERQVGRGRVLAWGSTFDNVWNDLPLQPVFLPLVRQLAQHAAGWDGERPWQLVGEALDVAGLARGDSAAADWVALAPSGRQVRLAAGATAVPLDEAGVWEVRRFGARGTPARLVAVNVDPAESDVARVPQAEVVAAIAPRTADGAPEAETVTLTPAEREARQSLWWWMLLAAALLLAAEAMLANRSSAARRPA